MGAPINSCVLGNITGSTVPLLLPAMIVDIGSEVQRPFVEALESGKKCRKLGTNVKANRQLTKTEPLIISLFIRSLERE